MHIKQLLFNLFVRMHYFVTYHKKLYVKKGFLYGRFSSCTSNWSESSHALFWNASKDTSVQLQKVFYLDVAQFFPSSNRILIHISLTSCKHGLIWVPHF